MVGDDTRTASAVDSFFFSSFRASAQYSYKLNARARNRLRAPIHIKDSIIIISYYLICINIFIVFKFFDFNNFVVNIINKYRSNYISTL